MSRHTWRAAAVAALMLALGSAMAAPATAAGSSSADQWFARLTPAQIVPFVHTFPSWSSQGSTDPQALSFGAASPTLGYSLPTYDLGTGKVTGSTQLANGMTRTGGYCARLLVHRSPTDIVVCSDPGPGGRGFQIAGASDVQFLGSAADLPAGGTTAPDHNFVAVVGAAVVPMDRSARSWLGASSVNGSEFIKLVAQRVAGWAAINKLHGPSVGGDIPLIGGNRAEVAAFEAAVAKGSGVPVSRLTHPWSVAGVETVVPSAGSSSGWIVPIAALLALVAAGLLGTHWRQRRLVASR